MTSISLAVRTHNATSKVSILEKLFIWSLITEPLLFFILIPGAVTGLPITLSRVFQGAFLLLYVLNLIFDRKRIPIGYPLRNYNHYVIFYCLLIFLSSFVGVVIGSYSIDALSVNIYSEAEIANSFIGVYFKPVFEMFILIYYFVYFLVLPRFFIYSKAQLSYLFKWIIRVFYLVVILGLFDVLTNVLGFDLIPRHLIDSSWITVGLRFHSIAGEPRDAFVYLFFGLSILYLMAGLNLKSPPRRALIFLIFLCIILTQSFSGILGIFFGLILFVVFRKTSFKNYITFILLILISIIAGYVSMEYSPRIQEYVDMIIKLPEVMKNRDNLPYLVNVQAPDIVPIWLLLTKMLEFDFYSVFFGSGIGSASFAINNFLDISTGVTNNPRSQIVRLLFESGIIGTYIYLLILIKPVKRLSNIVKKNYWPLVWASSIMLFGSVLGHRSNLGLIFSGIVFAIIINRLYKPVDIVPSSKIEPYNTPTN
jgi:hypothetical protein